MLIDQCRGVSAKAVSDGDLTAGEWTTIDGYLTAAESALSAFKLIRNILSLKKRRKKIPRNT